MSFQLTILVFPRDELPILIKLSWNSFICVCPRSRHHPHPRSRHAKTTRHILSTKTPTGTLRSHFLKIRFIVPLPPLIWICTWDSSPPEITWTSIPLPAPIVNSTTKQVTTPPLRTLGFRTSRTGGSCGREARHVERPGNCMCMHIIKHFSASFVRLSWFRGEYEQGGQWWRERGDADKRNPWEREKECMRDERKHIF